LFAATETGQDESGAAGDYVAAVQLRRDMNREGAFPQGFGGEVRVGGGLEEISPHRKKDRRLAPVYRENGADHIVADLSRRSEAELPVDGVVVPGRHLFKNPHGAVA